MTLSIVYTNVNVLKHGHLALLSLGLVGVISTPPRELLGQGAAERPGAPGDSVIYRLDRSSLLLVHAGKSGLLKGLGHEHRVRAHAFSGTVVYFPDDLGRSRVSVTVLADSLFVVPEADSADIPEITKTMRGRTLRVDSFPEIVFESRRIEGIEGIEGTEGAGGTGGAGGTRRVRVNGDLTMVGVTRPVSVDLTIEVTPDTLRADGTLVAKQTDFGIKPYSKALGLVKVKNEVRFELRVVGIAVLPEH